MTREKGHDEIYCRSCGEPIKKKAEICPECGVPNEYGSAGGTPPTGKSPGGDPTGHSSDTAGKSRRNTAPATAGSGVHDPDDHTTTVDERWYYGVAASVGLWVLGFALPEGSALAGFFFLTAWALMPLSVYFDREWVRATRNWDPNPALWVVLSVVPLVNIVAGCAYLIKRHGLSQVSPPTETGSETNDPALARLRERYSQGELTDEEFEAKVGRLVGTEDRDVAEISFEEAEEEASVGSEGRE